MLNKFIGIGRWSRDPELRYSKEGTAITNCSIAINDKFNKDNTTFLNVVCFKRVAENTAQFTTKGSLVAIEGKIQTRSYDTDNGKRYVTEVIADSVQFLDSKGNSSNQQQTPPKTGNKEPTGIDDNDPFSDDGTPIDISDDDLPF